jgi:hypothetical protein
MMTLRAAFSHRKMKNKAKAQNNTIATKHKKTLIRREPSCQQLEVIFNLKQN